MKLIFAFTFICLLFSCKEEKQEIVDLSDIIAKSENYNGEKPEDTVKLVELKLTDVFLDEKQLLKVNLGLNKLRLSDTLMFLDRFKTAKKTAFLYSLDKDSVLYSKWNFNDSIKTKNAFLNWTNCFGTRCNSIGIGQKTNLQKAGFLLMMNDTCMIYVGTNSKQEQEKWLAYYTSDKKQKWTYILTQTPNNKVNWRFFKENKLEPIEEKSYSFE